MSTSKNASANWRCPIPHWARCAWPTNCIAKAWASRQAASRSVWLRHRLQTFKLRLKALEAHVSKTGAVLTEAQVAALERKADDDVINGEIGSAHPGYLGCQDTFYVGTLKCVGRIYQQTFIDAYPRSESDGCRRHAELHVAHPANRR